MDYLDLLKITDDSKLTIAVSLPDLKLFSRQLIAECLQRMRENENGKHERFLTAEEVKNIVSISTSTLVRWEKAHILMPVRVGGRKRYRETDVMNLVTGRVGNE